MRFMSGLTPPILHYIYYENPKCPFLVVMSATFNAEHFADYLLKGPKRYENIIKVAGLTFPIEENWLEYDSSNYLQDAVNKALELHQKNTDDFEPAADVAKKLNKSVAEIKEAQIFRDILIFVGGGGDARKIVGKLEQANKTDKFCKSNPVYPIQLMGEDVKAQTQNYKDIEKPIGILRGKPKRRIIVASNVAETGITIDTLKYVIDTGFLKSSEYNPLYSVELLVTSPVTKGMSMQRRGRAGRKAPGYAYFLYTKKTFDLLQDDEHPGLIKQDVTLSILSLIIKESDPEGEYNKEALYKVLNEDYLKKIESAPIDLFKIDLLDLPTADAIHTSLDKLYLLGAITSNTTPTSLGFIINKFRMISLESVKMMLSGFAWEVSILDLITIAAFANMHQADKLYTNRKENFNKAIMSGKIYWSWQSFTNNWCEIQLMLSCDFCQYLLLCNMCSAAISKNNSDIYKWCEDLGLSYSTLAEISDRRDDIMHSMNSIGLNTFSNFDKSFKFVQPHNVQEYIKGIKHCLYEGYKCNIAIWNDKQYKYLTKQGHIPIDIERYFINTRNEISTYAIANPKYIIYDKILFRQDPRSNTYDTSCSHISVLDGFIEIDDNFDRVQK